MDPLEKRVAIGDGDYLGEGEERVIPLVACRGRLEVDDRLSRGRVKMAAAEEAVAAASKITPDPNRRYILVVGLGSDEFWGTNNNGDSFPENALLGMPPKDKPMTFFDKYAKRLPKVWGYETFKKAHLFEEHQNNHPKHAMGGVHDSFWNNRMHRVENMVYFDRTIQKSAKWVAKVDAGEPVGTSMACKVPFDRCSLCHNLAPTRAQYCSHLRPGAVDYQLRQIRPDGRNVSMINDFPDFFDESCVETPAAPEALMILKVASEQKEAQRKVAEIKKEVPSLPVDIMDDDDRMACYMHESPMPKEALQRMRPYGLPAIVTGLRKLGMCLRPSELFYLTHYDAVDEKAASDLDRKVILLAAKAAKLDVPARTIYCELAGPLVASKVAAVMDLARPYQALRSYDEPYVLRRMLKSAGSRPIAEPISDLEVAMIEMYHALHKAAGGYLGIGRMGV